MRPVRENGLMRAKLLVSASSIDEVELLTDLPLAIIDLKDPQSGPLGASLPEVVRSSCERLATEWHFAGGARLSVACGELVEGYWHRKLPRGVSFVKAGPSKIEDVAELKDHLRRFALHAGTACQPVAVAYADFENAKCLPPETICATASELGYRWFLIDTFSKDGRSLLDWMSIRALCSLRQLCDARNVKVVLAGSIDERHLQDITLPCPDLLGVRGAVCEGDRSTQIDRGKALNWCEAVAKSLGTVESQALAIDN